MLELESLGVSRVAEPYFRVHRIGYKACIRYSLRWITQFLSQQPSDALKESSSGTIPKTWNGAPFVYDGKGCLQWFGLPIFECNAFCGCDEDCPNRVVQNGRRYVVNIKRTENKGWGISNGPKKIPRGSFIGVCAGELLTVGEADRRGTLYNKFGRTYLFDIDFHHMGSEAVYSVDAYHAGNLTRFLNHSCDPNCEIQACYINEANIEKPMLAIFTVREVEPFGRAVILLHGSD
ncbi:SET domain-containing protein [Rhizopogon salebrosus TDB-379]|nr:SET domain-containing protein [Rhizopogon salebrosus TDB-379]